VSRLQRALALAVALAMGFTGRTAWAVSLEPAETSAVPLPEALAEALTAVLTAEASAVEAAAPETPIERLDQRFDALVPAGARLDKVADGFTWVEGPLWRRDEGDLLFSDVPGNAIFRWREKEGASLFLKPAGSSGGADFDGPEPGSNGLALDPEGRLVLCQHGDRRVARRESDGRLTPLAERYEKKRLNSPNDLVYRSNGDLYFTDPPFGLPRAFSDPGKELDFQGIYRLSKDGSLTLLTREVRAPNGIGFSPDEKTLYVANADRENPLWLAFPVLEDGTLGKGRVFHDGRAWVKRWEGVPDGLKVDRNGNVFAAGPGGLRVFSPDGTHLGSFITGVATSNCAWGEDGSTLFITAGPAIYRVRLITRGAGF
jgi:gluconolactonase